MLTFILLQWTTTFQIPANILLKEGGTLHAITGYSIIRAPRDPSQGSWVSLWLHCPLIETQQSSPQLTRTQHILVTWQSPNESFAHLWSSFFLSSLRESVLLAFIKMGNWGKEVYQLSHDIKSFQAKLSPGIIYIDCGFIVKHWKLIF